jgi:succinylglutamic semialdehyde dehydrogenase
MSTVRGNLIGGDWVQGSGPLLESRDPGTGETVFSGNCVDAREVSNAATLAHQALEDWQDVPVLEKTAILNRYADALRAQRGEVALIISRETGKPLWESLTEVDAMVNKVGISVEALHERRRPTERQQAGAVAATRYKPMGVMAVFGPFNMPGHLPNGHIVPALLAGNTVVFKPSELTPGVAVKMVQLLQSAGVPSGVINLVQGGRDIGAALATDSQVDGILFTGSVAGGLAISRGLVDRPNKIVALEMGGNNPLVVWEPADIDAAAYLTVQSAFLTSGQRCSCARRLIVAKSSKSRAFVDRLVAMIQTIRVGHFSEKPEPFMGPVISDAAADRLLDAQRELIARGGKPLVEMSVVGQRRAMLRPGLIDQSNCTVYEDTEHFGPLLQLTWVDDFDEAIDEANETAYGLAAGLFSDDPALWERFYRKIRAGVVYWNRQTTGGSSHLPFGGVGLSGNHRPSGYWAADYCSYPVASMEVPTLTMPAQRTPGIG